MTNSAESETELSELVTFRVGEQDFCVDIMSVREIRGWSPATCLPHAPPYVMGVMNLRGSVVPIVDLAARLGLGAAVPDPRRVIVIAVVGQQTVGFLVNAVSDVIGVPRSDVQPTPDVAAESSGTFIEGVIALKDRMLRLVDLGALLPPVAQREAS
jgi:purine-binding chemotaxis protein CheW